MSIFADPVQSQERDLKSFLSAIELAVKNKQLTDPDGSLLKSVPAVQEQSAKMTEAFHGADQRVPTGITVGGREHVKYRELGGLSAFLPSRTVLNTHEQAVRQTPIGSLFWPCRSTDSFFVRKLNAAEIPKNFEKIESQLRAHPETLRYWQTTARPAVENLQSQLNSSEQKFAEAVGPVLTAAEKLVTMPPFAKQIEDYKKKFDPNVLYEKEEVHDNTGWNKFLKQLGKFKNK